jgi:hypothetical protein
MQFDNFLSPDCLIKFIKMKTKLFLMLLAAASFLSQPTHARNIKNAEDDAIAVVEVKGSTNGKTLILDLSNLQNDDVSISILDNEERVIYEETASDVSKFTKKFNLSKLEVGNYTLKVAQKKFKTVQPFEVTFKNVVVDEKAKKFKFDPIVKQKEGKLEVNVPLSDNQVVVTIIDAYGVTVFEDVNADTQSFRKKYDLKNLSKGNYLVEVTVEGETFYHNIKQ